MSPIHSDSATSNPLETLRTAVQALGAYLKSLDDKEAAIRKERDTARAELGKLLSSAGIVPAANGSKGPVLALNQDKLHHRIARFLRDNPRSRISEIAKGLSETSEKIAVELSKLRESKQVQSEGKARGTAYSLAA